MTELDSTVTELKSQSSTAAKFEELEVKTTAIEAQEKEVQSKLVELTTKIDDLN